MCFGIDDMAVVVKTFWFHFTCILVCFALHHFSGFSFIFTHCFSLTVFHCLFILSHCFSLCLSFRLVITLLQSLSMFNIITMKHPNSSFLFQLFQFSRLKECGVFVTHFQFLTWIPNFVSQLHANVGFDRTLMVQNWILDMFVWLYLFRSIFLLFCM